MDKLPPASAPYITDETNHLLFSPASIWEIVIKKGQNRPDFNIDPHLLYNGLLLNGYSQIDITARHTLMIDMLPNIHKDPFDRILLAQAMAEEITLLTFDSVLANYPSPVILLKKKICV
ncbi:MAG: type II toxin-antitoxin system VapC family toxin [Defluviitaleaceae bacterium]|nr:type II toxin-antitoxin system VapC family toxin [Defluviitaleaceae bacterium]